MEIVCNILRQCLFWTFSLLLIHSKVTVGRLSRNSPCPRKLMVNYSAQRNQLRIIFVPHFSKTWPSLCNTENQSISLLLSGVFLWDIATKILISSIHATILLIFFHIVACRNLLVICKTGFGLNDWIYCTLYIHNSGLETIQRYHYSTHFQFTVAHALGYSVFTSCILATDLSQSHCNFKSYMKSSCHHLIPFLSFLLNHFRLPSPELD
jgi:hypothetical protein